MRYHKIPDETVRRLPVYYRGVVHHLQQGLKSISSRDLADFVGVHPWQIRKDFSYFGDFGTPGVGYETVKLLKHIQKVLKLNVVHKAALVGAGNLGSALLAFPGFGMYGFEIAAVFDVDKRKIGRKKCSVMVQDIKALKTTKLKEIDLGIIAVPEEATQEVADALVQAGVKGILNFSPRYIEVPKKVKVISIDIAMDLARLPYYMPAG